MLITGFAILESSKAPLVIDRGCKTNIATLSDKRSEDELKSFIKLVLPMRFNSKVIADPGLLSTNEFLLQNKEKLAFKKQNMLQFVFIRKINPQKGFIYIEADRLISVGNIRSAFKLLLKLTIQIVDRSKYNPYGLKLKKTEVIKKNKKRGL